MFGEPLFYEVIPRAQYVLGGVHAGLGNERYSFGIWLIEHCLCVNVQIPIIIVPGLVAASILWPTTRGLIGHSIEAATKPHFLPLPTATMFIP